MATFNAYPATQVQLPNFAQALAQAQQIKGMQQQQKMAELQMDAYQRQQERDAKTQQLRSNYLGGDEASGQQLLANDPAAFTEVVTAQSAGSENQVKQHLQRSRAVNVIAETAQTPEDFLARVANIPGISPERIQASQQAIAAGGWDAFRENTRRQAMTFEQILAQGNADRTFRETERNNRFSNNIAAQNAATSRMSATPTEVREYEYAARQAKAAGQPMPSFTDWAQGMKASAASRTNINTGATQESAFQKEVGKEFANVYIDTQKNAAAARSKVATLNRMGQLAEDLTSGAGGETLLRAKKALQAIGIDVGDDISGAEAFQAMANKMALEARSTAEGGGMPGAMSDKDREFLVNINPNLSTTREGNLMKIEAARRLAARQLEQAQLMRDYMQENGGRLDGGYFAVEAEYFADKPLFDDLRRAGSAAPAAGNRAAGPADRGINPGAALQFRKDGGGQGNAPDSALSPEQQEIFKRLMQ
jgi:hypothetical protein